ncbi:MAG: DUF1028 domain-containing protein [Myxococcales bacterium]|nr:DUF1028 domain-containing protein [Myxococcales bacterium]
MLVIGLATTAHATWSIVAADADTGQVGGAGTSCVGPFDVGILFAAAPGVGAVHAQAFVNEQGRDRAAELLAKGSTPDEALNAITDPAADPYADFRQYGVVSLDGESVAWTGASNGDWAGDLQGTDARYTYSAQGNLLTGPEVVQRTADAFGEPKHCDLAEKLIRGLEAGAAPGEGDARCAPALPSDSAFIRLVDASGTVLLDLSVVDTAPVDPLVALRTEFETWRDDNPCPEPPKPKDTGEPVTTGDTAVPDDTGVEPDTAERPASDAARSCGCGSGGAVGWLMLAGLVPIVRRKR